MRILIVGGGGIGRMLFDRFFRSGHKATLVARRPVAEVIRTGVSLVSTPDYTHGLPSGPVFETIAEAFADGTKYTIIVIAVKSYDTATVAEELAPFVTNWTTILTVQNGIGNEEALKERLPGIPILAGVLTTPVEVISETEIRIMKDRFWIGLAEHTPHALSMLTKYAFEKAGFTVEVFVDAQSLKWSKILMNIMANASCAILGNTPAQIFADSRLGALEVEMLKEALAVMQAMGTKVVKIDGHWLPLLAKLIRRAPMMLTRWIIGRLVIRARGGKMPSLYHDTHPRPRGKSEVGWLNGAVAKEAAKRSMRTPVNAVFTRVLGVLTKGHEPTLLWHNGSSALLDAVDDERDNEPTHRAPS